MSYIKIEKLSSIGSRIVGSSVNKLPREQIFLGRDEMSKEFVKFYRLEPLI